MVDYKTNPDKKPPTLAVIPENIPAILKSLRKWVCWRWEWVDNEWTKPPVDVRTGAHASTTKRETWSTFSAALKCLLNPDRGFDVDGIGFVLEPKDGIVGIDWDKVIDPETGEVLWDVRTDVEALEARPIKPILIFGSRCRN